MGNAGASRQRVKREFIFLTLNEAVLQLTERGSETQQSATHRHVKSLFCLETGSSYTTRCDYKYKMHYDYKCNPNASCLLHMNQACIFDQFDQVS